LGSGRQAVARGDTRDRKRGELSYWSTTMKKLLILSILALATSPALAQSSHEYSPLVESTVNYKNWSLPNLKTDQADDLRKLIAVMKLVMIVYFAPWCGNWKNEAPIAAKLYDKYKSQGFQVIAVSEYASRDDVKKYFGPDGPPYPVVTESESRDDKLKTPHYEYRQLTGDKRNWGSPWNIFLEPDKVNAKGDVLAEKAWVVNGELIEDEVDKFIASKVGAASAAAVIQPCKN
jgi:thiol-disulfide isomerase/thioredoxin